ncbi:AraC family transcriptional regulator [Sinanaerobacter sp. ZZT-01]|uniref:AraC family transcriptional regulator n=1 Tax=Sinanaerobacter sp. ZZT-01 TaxID=3111540 RepID=UPI002D77129A|nr:AraC family transcriptional regulator [Sinanaerobacter sp. ZZT-01]WRR93812.1 AraC family transcriptional regulator [Sinanaerobacter sp. ZZT-01]
MDWITGIQRAIDYIEDNITENLDYDEIAKRAYSSSYHFQRVFGILCGQTLGEYIRERRLTLAASELVSSNGKVIDVAIKYGYDSSESFGRAFSKFHGVTPSKAKSCGKNLKSFSKLTVKLVLEGGTVMNYRIEEKKAFKVIEKVKLFSTKNEENMKGIPLFWDASRNDGTIQKLCEFCVGTELDNLILGICYGDNCDNTKEFSYSIATGYNGNPVPDGFRVNQIKSSTWAIFKCKGAMPIAIQNMWHRIYTEFFPTSDYIPKNEVDFEVYPDGDMNSQDYESEIWIAVEKK